MNGGEWFAVCLAGLTLWVLLSGLDELFLQGTLLVRRAAGKGGPRWPGAAELEAAPSPRASPSSCRCGTKQHVIARMLEHNLAAIGYAELRLLRRRLSQRPAHGRRGARGRAPLPQRPRGPLPARRPHLQGRLPQLDLPAHAAARGGARRALRGGGHPRRRRPHPPRSAPADQLFRRALRHGAGARAAAPHAAERLDARALLRRIRRIPDQGHPRAAGAGRLHRLERRGHRLHARGAGRTGGQSTPAASSSPPASPRITTPASASTTWAARSCSCRCGFAAAAGGHARILPARFPRRRQTAHALGDGHRAAGLGASRLARARPGSFTGSGATARAWSGT